MAGTGEGDIFLGIDVGTSGVRACAIDGRTVASAAQPMPDSKRNGAAIEQSPDDWWTALQSVLGSLRGSLDLQQVRRIAVDGTSGTLLLIDEEGAPLTPGLMYNDTRSHAEAKAIAGVAPPESGAHGATSALAKLIYLKNTGAVGKAHRAVHQADWIAGGLAGKQGISDENNALKLGYDPVRRSWPAWLAELGVPGELLPRVEPPGKVIGKISPIMARAFGFSSDTEICAGTTDGVAAFIATRASGIGDAVTSLGTTLTLKALSDKPIFAPALGVYSHRLGDRWLVGGASNSGGAALLAHFSREEIAALSARLRPDEPTGLDYYPLAAVGERFPICDPGMAPRLSPRPDDRRRFLQGLMEGIAAVEALGYRRLVELGAPPLRRVVTVGGGATNAAWTRIRTRVLGLPVSAVAEVDTAFGTALLALHKGAPE